MLGGTQSGKTCLGPHWLLREIQDKGPGDYLIVTSTYPLLNLKLLPEFLYVFNDLMHLGSWSKSERTFTFWNKKTNNPKDKRRVMYPGKETRVIIVSATNPESIESATAKAAWLDEAGQTQFGRDAFEAVRRRLSLAQGRILITTTLYNLGWLKALVYDPWKNGDNTIKVVHVDSIENPAFSREEYDSARALLPDWKFDLLYRGQFAKPAGLIYDAFNESICLIPRRALPVEWDVYVGHDFGSVNTAACFYKAHPTTGFLYLFATYHDGGKTAAEHVSAWKDIVGDSPVVARVGGAPHEDGWREAFNKNGWAIAKPKIGAVDVGIDRVYAMHKTNKLMIFNDLGEYLDEKHTYSRKLDEAYTPIDGTIQNKARYHHMDAERYIISEFAPEVVTKIRRMKRRIHYF